MGLVEWRRLHNKLRKISFPYRRLSEEDSCATLSDECFGFVFA